MNARPPSYTPTDPLFPFPPLFLSSHHCRAAHRPARRMDERRFGESPAMVAVRLAAALSARPSVRRLAEVLTAAVPRARSEEHTSELQSLMRISYAVFCLKKKRTKKPNIQNNRRISQKNNYRHR